MIFKKLFEPISLKNLQIKNRIIMPPMHTNQGSMQEGIGNDAIDFYVTRAKGGFGMIGVGVIDTYFVPGASSPRAFFLLNGEHVKKYQKLVKRVKDYDAVIYGQIGVRRVFKVSDLHRFPKLSALSQDQIHEMVDSLIETSIRVKEANFDAIELLGTGGGAISLFLSNVFNDREDSWGGTLENRLRFPIEILKGIKKEVGDDYPIFFRFHGSEFIPGGYSFETEKVIALKLREAGVNFFNVTGGGHGTNVPGLTPAMPRGGFAFLAREIKSVVDVPVAASNRINHPVVAEDILRKGWADMISVGRGSLADPEWPSKAKKGCLEEIRTCIACNECLDTVVIHERQVRCTVNPKVGTVAESTPLPKARRKKRVMVVGGGCTGLQAALTCAERGHQVYIVEKASYLGGKWRLAPLPTGREELVHFLLWLVHQVIKVGVEIRTDTEFSPTLVKEIKPDAIIVCTGSRQSLPDIPGVTLPNVVSAEGVLEGDVEVGGKVVIIGGGGVGTGTALYLAKRWSCSPEIVSFLMDFEAVEKKEALSMLNKGHQVTIVVRSEKVGKSIGPGTKWVIHKELELAGVEIITNARVKEIRKEGVLLEKNDAHRLVEADTVVLATGFRPHTELYEKIKTWAPEVHVTGTASKMGHTIEGIKDAFEVAMSL